jgi:hypothetical protein
MNMDPIVYLDLKDELIKKGFGSEIEWAETVKRCDKAEDFCTEYIWVICNSGMKNQIAEIIYQRILQAMCDNRDISEVFGHQGKVEAIKSMIKDHVSLFRKYLSAENKLEFCKSLPWIGDITKYHLAKNLGENCIKPDRHLVRIAEKYGLDAFSLCKKLAEVTGDRLHTVDVVLWRSGNLGLI